MVAEVQMGRLVVLAENSLDIGVGLSIGLKVWFLPLVLVLDTALDTAPVVIRFPVPGMVLVVQID